MFPIQPILDPVRLIAKTKESMVEMLGLTDEHKAIKRVLMAMIDEIIEYAGEIERKNNG